MRTNSKVGTIVVALLLLGFLSEGSQVAQITTNTKDQMDPAVYGNYVVWEDDRNGNWDIYGLNLVTLEEIQITTHVSNQYDPALHNDTVVWMDERNGNNDIYGFNLSALEEFQITTDASSQINPAIYSDTVVWQDYRNGNWDVYGFNLSTLEEFQITTSESNQVNPVIYSDTVVWQDYRNGNWDIYGFNLGAQEEFQITTNTKDQINAAIYSDTIVWQDDRNGNDDIYTYSLLTGQELQITTNVSNQMNAAVYNNTLVWEDDRNGNYNIYQYNLLTSEEIHIDPTPVLQRNPAVHEDMIVWEDNRNGNSDIYGYNLPTITFTVTVVVSDSNGTPIPGASVTLGSYTGVTDETGAAVLTPIPSGTYALTVFATTYQEWTQPVQVTRDELISVTLESELIDSDTDTDTSTNISVAVTVEDTSQNPVPAATVTLAGPQTYTNITDAQGDAVFFNVVSGEYTLSVSAAGYREWTQPIQITEDNIIAVTLESDLSLTITVQNASQAPVAGATVILRGPATYTDTTNTQGTIVVSDITHGIYTLTVSHDDYGTYTDPNFEVTTSITTIVMLNPEMGFVHGIVYWDTTETPAKDITVRIYDQTTTMLEKNVTTDFEGRFIAEVPKIKKYYIVVEDFADQKYMGITPVNALSRGALTLIVDPQCHVKGVVTDESGKELSGADIVLKDTKDQITARKFTDNSGLFTVKVTPGTYSVEITASGYQLHTEIFTVSHKEIYNFGNITLKKKPEQRIDVPDATPPVQEPKPEPSQSVMISVLITLGICVLLLITVVMWGKNKSDLVKTALISVLTGIIAIIAMWILFQIG